MNAIMTFIIKLQWCGIFLGFFKEILRACCGGGGSYNVNPSINCGDFESKVCFDPSCFVNWDGI